MHMSNTEIRSPFVMLSQAMKEKVNKEVVDPANLIRGISYSRVREFLRMKPPKFCGSKVDEDPNMFIEKLYKVAAIMG